MENGTAPPTGDSNEGGGLANCPLFAVEASGDGDGDRRLESLFSNSKKK